MQLSTASRYFVPVRSKRSPQHPVLKHLQFSRDGVTSDGFGLAVGFIGLLTLDYTSQITITKRILSSVTLLGNGFKRQTFLCFRADVLPGWQFQLLAGWRLSHD
jgi:hypothetical protein